MSALAVLMLLSVVLLARRLAGGLQQPLDSPALFTLGGLLFGLAVLAVQFGGDTVTVLQRRTALVLRAVITCLLVIVALSISLPATPFPGLAALWFCVFAAAALVWAPLFEQHAKVQASDPGNAQAPSKTEAPVVQHAAVTTEEVTDGEQVEDEVLAEVDDPEVVQSQKRIRTAQGVDVVHGTVRIAFAAEQRTEVAHIAFCPPFEQPPHLQLIQVSGPLAQLKETQLATYGLRLEAKLNAALKQSESIVVEYYASTSELTDDDSDDEEVLAEE